MRLLPFLALAPLVSAQYFSAGWQPGQPAHDAQDAPAPTYTPGAEQTPLSSPAAASQSSPKSLSELFSVNTLLTLPPVAAVFQRFGINITERVALIKTDLWDERITLITDNNYKDLIVNEPLTEEEEDKRVWVMVISVTSAKQEGVSKFLDQVFDSAYNESIHANDLPDVRWGRIDYLNVTHLTTKWNVWQPPYLVILTDRGQSLRFYQAHQIRLRDYALREFLLNEGWKKTPVWESRFAPGGDREWIIDLFATYLTKLYNVVVIIPRWLLLILTGGIGSVILNFLHRPSKKAAARKEAIKRDESTSASGTQATTTEKPAVPSTPAPAVKVKSEPTEKPPTTTPTASPRRSGKKGKGKKHQA